MNTVTMTETVDNRIFFFLLYSPCKSMKKKQNDQILIVFSSHKNWNSSFCNSYNEVKCANNSYCNG